jgi:hypothetical protein
MAFEITFSVHPRLLVLRGHGTGSSAEGELAVRDLRAHAGYDCGVPILIDLNGLECAPSDVRAFAEIVATAFPSSLLALVGRPGESYEPAKDIARLALTRGGTVAAFTGEPDALAWLNGQNPSTRRLDPLVIPYSLREKIESTHVDVDGFACPLRLDSAAGRPLLEPEVAEVTVSTEYAGAPRLATVDVRVSSLDDEDYVVLAIVRAIRRVLAGAHAPSPAIASAARH